MRKAAGLSRTVCSYKKLCFKVSCNYYLYIFIFIVHFQKKLVNLGTTLLRTLRTLQKARRSNSSFLARLAQLLKFIVCRRVGLRSTSDKWSQICPFVKMESGKQISVVLFCQKLAILLLEHCHQLYTNVSCSHINGLHLPHTCQKKFPEILFSPPKVQHRIKIPQYFSPIVTFIFFGF